MTKSTPSVAFHIVGDAFVDLFCFLQNSLPEPGGDAHLTQPIQTMAGGSAVNSATHLAAATTSDNPVTLHTALNPHDEYGQLLLAHASKHGIPCMNCVHDDSAASTGHCIVMVTNEDRSFLTHHGVVAGLSPDNVAFDAMASETNPIHVHIAGFYNLPKFWNGALQERIEWLRDQRRTKTTCISLVTQHDATGAWDGGLLDLLPLLDFVILNELEANYVTRAKENNDSVHQWVNYFSKVAPKTCAVITRGELGAIAIRNGTIIANQAAVKVSSIDPTGAGDAFCAGFMKGIWDSRLTQQPGDNDVVWSPHAIQSALIHGCSLATCSVLTKGASVPSDSKLIQDFVRRTTELV